MNTNKKSAVILLSGGLDSFVCLDMTAKKYDIKLALTFDYGQEVFEEENKSAAKMAELYKIEHKTIKLPFLKEIKNNEVWIPNRNGLFLNIAGCFCDSKNYDFIIFGANKEEAEDFKDNSEKFVNCANTALEFSTRNKAKILCPLLKLTKAETLEYAIKNDLDLSLIKSCYKKAKNGKKHCGKCASCLFIKKALKKLKREDLLQKLGF